MQSSDFQIIVEYVGKKYEVIVTPKYDPNLTYVISQISPFLQLVDPFVDFNPQDGFYWKPEPMHPSFKPIVAKEISRKTTAKSVRRSDLKDFRS